MSTRVLDDELTRRLQEADPLTEDSGLTAAERTAMRRTILSQVPAITPDLWRHLSPAFAAAFLLAVALAVAWWPSSVSSPIPGSVPPTQAATSEAGSPPSPGIQRAGDSLETRKIQFETPGGTLVVWVLNPNFPS
jgi:hypothetical protein